MNFCLSFIIAGFYFLYPALALPSADEVMNKYCKWKLAIQDPSDYQKVFAFFYNNPHWPRFKDSVKDAEKNIPRSSFKSLFLLKWFKRYPPITGDGIIAFTHCLLETDPDRAKLYIKQTWVLRNFTDLFVDRYLKEFRQFLTPVDDAKRVKRLMQQNKIQQLIAMKKLTTPQVTEYITRFLREYFVTKSSGFSVKDLQDPQKRLNIVQNLIDRKQIAKAADILLTTNQHEERYDQNFFNQRRYVAYEILRSGKPKLAYQIMEQCKLRPHRNNDNRAKAKWLLGYISYRFLEDYNTAIDHFEDAYNSSTTAIRLSKNACWLAEVHRAKNDVVLAIEWYRKAAIHFNTFYGCVAYWRLSSLPGGRFSTIDDVYTNDFALTPTHLEVRFYGRELVKTLMEISKRKADKRYIKDFYRQLIDEIDDPNEELLLLDLALINDELPTLISTAARKQHFFVGKRAYKTLGGKDMTYVQEVQPDLCFKALVHAVIHSESNFDEGAKSYVGAVGLMQIMPSTANYEMKRLRFYIGKNVSLFDRRKNLLIGASILSRLLKKYSGNTILALAAYNCGEGNVSKFQKSTKNLRKLSYIDFMELIPFKETRIYVKHVIKALLAYQEKFGASDCYHTPSIINFKS
ncbi:MAG: lytic transglycosylase domain-containing protein [Holosporales bacterium]|nr:lytic transglycosylase domain-containing protein [Holosporales bacterium]